MSSSTASSAVVAAGSGASPSGGWAPLSLDDARVLAQEYLRGVRYGQDPAGDRQALRQAPRVEDLAERYLREHADVKKKPRSAKMDHVNHAPARAARAWGRMRVDTLTRADVAQAASRHAGDAGGRQPGAGAALQDVCTGGAVGAAGAGDESGQGHRALPGDTGASGI